MNNLQHLRNEHNYNDNTNEVGYNNIKEEFQIKKL